MLYTSPEMEHVLHAPEGQSHLTALWSRHTVTATPNVSSLGTRLLALHDRWLILDCSLLTFVGLQQSTHTHNMAQAEPNGSKHRLP
jgi:hypothetical protein